MGFLQRYLAANRGDGVMKSMRKAEIMNSPAYYSGERYTDPLTRMTVEPPTMAEYGASANGIAWLIVAPFALLARLLAGPRHVAAVPAPVPYTPGVPMPMTGAVVGPSYEQPFDADYLEPFVTINGQSVPREFADMYDHGLDVVCFHGEGNGQANPH